MGTTGGMDDATAEKIARNNAVFREANGEIATAAIEHGLDHGTPLPFICECSDRRCVDVIRLTLEEYARMRENPRWFAHALGHEERVEGAVEPLERNARYVLVEKTNHAGAVAAELARDQASE